jgi:hypothetical protein
VIIPNKRGRGYPTPLPGPKVGPGVCNIDENEHGGKEGMMEKAVIV